MKCYYFYHKYFPSLQDKIKQNTICPFHKDKDPSMSLDLDTGLYYCHSCQDGGDMYKFYMKYHNVSFLKAKKDIAGNEQFSILTHTEVDVAHDFLMTSKTIKDLLLYKRGWTEETVRQFKLGWLQRRIFIPIYDENSALVNIKKYDFLNEHKEKFLGVKGYNKIRLWPMEAFKNDEIALMAGEPDTILARQSDINAVTFTGGEGSFRQELLHNFKDKIVYIVYDIDKKGKQASRVIAEKLAPVVKSVAIVSLPEEHLPPNGDLTDYYMYCRDKGLPFKERWDTMVEEALFVDVPILEDEEYEKLSFHKAISKEYYGKNIQIKATVAGKGLSPYFAPKTINMKCELTKGDSCKLCRLAMSGGSYSKEIPLLQSLGLIRCGDEEQMNRIKSITGIYKCNQFDIEIEPQTIEEVFLSPIVDPEIIDKQFILRKAYVSNEDIQLNKIYEFKGKTVKDPKTQEATHLFQHATPEANSLENFQLLAHEIEELRTHFNPRDQTIKDIDVKVRDICKDINYNIGETLKGRESLIFAYDLAYHSVLKFKFNGNTINKGLVELLVLGDTRTGKTKVAQKLLKHYNAGEYITLETATVPGLIGGLSQLGRDTLFSWGTLPANDCRLVVLDEANALPVASISNLSAIRDTNIAERTVVGSTRRTSARVRLIWISNPRSTRSIDTYTSGVEAIRELIGRAEDIARFDLAIIVSKNDISNELINKPKGKPVEHKYTTALCSKLLTWAWSRMEADIKFEKQTETKIMELAIKMGDMYSDTIPLVQGSVQRIKLARLSAALACRLFSTEDGRNVIVKPVHAEYIYDYLNFLYNSKYFGYGDYSMYKREESKISGIDIVVTAIKNLRHPQLFISKTLNAHTILFEDLIDFSEITVRDDVKDMRTMLVTNNCLTRRKSYYIKTPTFINLLKKLKDGEV